MNNKLKRGVVYGSSEQSSFRGGNSINREYILITTSNFPIGGASANYLNLFCKGLKLCERSISVWLLKGFAYGNQTYKGARISATPEGIPYTYLSSTERPVSGFRKIFQDVVSLIRLIVKIFGLVDKRKSIILLVYSNELHFNIPIYLLGHLFGFRIVSFVPEYYDKSVFQQSLIRRTKWYGFLINFRYLNPLSSHLIIFSFFLKDLYIKQGVPNKKIIVQPNLTDFDFWKMQDSNIRFTLGYSGTPSIKDGLHDLLKAISLLKKKGQIVTLLVIGDNVFGKSLIPDFRDFCEQLNITELITFTGLVNLKSVRQHLSECKILALTRPNITQTQAGFPTKLGEYFASGKLVLTTDFGDIERYFVKGKEMIIAECGDIEDIASKIKWTIDNPTEARIITQNGYKKAVTILDDRKSIMRILPLIEI
jgi:glycosyltransferase involved in cell wall biosynthesis